MATAKWPAISFHLPISTKRTGVSLPHWFHSNQLFCHFYTSSLNKIKWNLRKAKRRGQWGPQPDGSLFCSAKLNIWDPLKQAINCKDWINAKLASSAQGSFLFSQAMIKVLSIDKKSGVFLRGINNTKRWEQLGWYTVLAFLTMLLHPQRAQKGTEYNSSRKMPHWHLSDRKYVSLFLTVNGKTFLLQTWFPTFFPLSLLFFIQLWIQKWIWLQIFLYLVFFISSGGALEWNRHCELTAGTTQWSKMLALYISASHKYGNFVSFAHFYIHILHQNHHVHITCVCADFLGRSWMCWWWRDTTKREATVGYFNEYWLSKSKVEIIQLCLCCQNQVGLI